MYYIQHYAMLLIPLYLASQGGPFTLEPFTQVTTTNIIIQNSAVGDPDPKDPHPFCRIRIINIFHGSGSRSISRFKPSSLPPPHSSLTPPPSPLLLNPSPLLPNHPPLIPSSFTPPPLPLLLHPLPLLPYPLQPSTLLLTLLPY